MFNNLFYVTISSENFCFDIKVLLNDFKSFYDQYIGDFYTTNFLGKILCNIIFNKTLRITEETDSINHHDIFHFSMILFYYLPYNLYFIIFYCL